MSAPPAADDAAAADEAADDLFEGAGVVSSVYDLGEAVQEQDASGIAAAGVAAGLDTLGVAADPLGAFAEAGVGWAIEHVSWLREPVDWLCGDPGRIEDTAQAWHALGATLREQAGVLAQAVPQAAQGWSGSAADGWLTTASADHDALTGIAATADEVARTVLGAGAMVGAERALIRDGIAAFVVEAAKWLIVAVGTGGIGGPAALTALVADAAVTALNMADRVAEVMRELKRLSELADVLGQEFGSAAARGVVDGVGSVPGLDTAVGAGVEVSKQAGAERATTQEWAGVPAG